MMPPAKLRDRLERHQIAIYFSAVALAAVAALAVPGTTRLDAVINPALAVMLFVTFLQVPLADLTRAFREPRLLGALMAGNFIAVPLLVAALLPLMPGDPTLRLGILLVLLTPCVDYVVTFAHLGRADARAILAATPLLLLAQMALLPLYLGFFLGADAAGLIAPGPFIEGFLVLIAGPLALAALAQAIGRRSPEAKRGLSTLGLLAVPATAFVLFVVVASAMPRLDADLPSVMSVAPVYVAYALLAPLLGLGTGRLLHLTPPQIRAVAFSTSTRNSLVVLPLALTVPDAGALLAAVVVTQTLVELIGELIYIRTLPKLWPKGNIDLY